LIAAAVGLVLAPVYAVAAALLTPIRAVVSNRVAIARYFAATGVAATVTLALLFTMQFVLGRALTDASDPRFAGVSLVDRSVEIREEAPPWAPRHKPQRPASPDQRPSSAEGEAELFAGVPRTSVDVAPNGMDLMPP